MPDLTARQEAFALAVARPGSTLSGAYREAYNTRNMAPATVAVEAMLAGKPVITVNLTGQPDVVPYAREGAALGAINGDEVLRAVRLALDGGPERERAMAAARAYVQRELAQCDGHATERVVDAVLSASRRNAPEEGHGRRQ